MANTAASEFVAYFDNLAATNDITVALGNTFTKGTNLFNNYEDDVDECLSVYTFGGAPGDQDQQRQYPAIQLRLKSTTRKKAISTMQSIINDLHYNGKVITSKPGIVFATQSSPILFDIREAGESIISISNYTVKMIRL